MSESQNTKNEQLTEQWKKGELLEGFYYVNDGAEVTIDYYLCDYWERHFGWDVQQIIAPVPSYEEWQAKLEENKRLKHDIGNLGYKIKNQRHEIDNRLKEIEKLKEQINKCCLDAINRGTANAVKAVKEFGMPERIEELVKQNAQLKELLKECEKSFQELSIGYKYCIAGEIADEMLQKIDEALK